MKYLNCSENSSDPFRNNKLYRDDSRRKIIIIFCIILLCSTVPYRTVPYTAPHRTAPHRTAPHRTAPHRTAPHRTAPHRTAPHRTAPHRTAPCHTVLFNETFKVANGTKQPKVVTNGHVTNGHSPMHINMAAHELAQLSRVTKQKNDACVDQSWRTSDMKDLLRESCNHDLWYAIDSIRQQEAPHVEPHTKVRETSFTYYTVVENPQ